MNKKCGWVGVILIALPFVKAAAAAFFPVVVPLIDLIPGALDQACTVAGAGMLSVSAPLHK